MKDKRPILKKKCSDCRFFHHKKRKIFLALFMMELMSILHLAVIFRESAFSGFFIK